MSAPLSTQKQQETVLKILWFAMLGTSLIYLFLGYVQKQAMPPIERSSLANMLWLFGAVFAGMGFVLPNMLFKNDVGYNGALRRSVVKWAMFESLGILSLTNLLAQGVSFGEFAAGVACSFALILFSKPEHVRN